MRRGIPFVVVFVALAAHAGEHNYRAGVLKRIDVKDVSSTLSIPAGSGQNIALPIALGINYQFQVQSDMIVYVGNCWSKDKRHYGAEWVVNDPIEFRVDKDKLFLKRPNKGEFRLALMTRLRVLPSEDEGGAAQSSVEPLPPLATRQTVPQCH
jgi:hypothetical protein